MALIDTAFARSRTVISALLLVLIAGTIAFVEIPK
jgi:multidrug efflux pump